MKLKICCNKFRFFKKIKAFQYFKVGNSWAGVPKGGVGLIVVDSKNPKLFNCQRIFFCPFCGKKIEVI